MCRKFEVTNEYFYRLNFLESEKVEQEIAISAHLELHRRIPELKNEYGKHTVKGSSILNKVENLNRHTMPYYFADLPICCITYLFLHGLKGLTIKKKYFDENGLSIREHKLTNKVPTPETLKTLSHS